MRENKTETLRDYITSLKDMAPEHLYAEVADEDFDDDDLSRQKTERYTQDTWHRHSLINWMMVVVSVWLIFVLAIVALNVPCHLFIGDSVLTTLLATTTVNILGLPFIILKDLFKGK